MLKHVACIRNGIGSQRLPDFQPFLRWTLSAHLSTNSAIGKSLRRSRYDDKEFERRPSGPLRTSAQDFVSSRHQRDEEPTFGKQTSHFNARRERNPRPTSAQDFVSSRHQRDEEPTFGKQTSHFNARRERNPRPTSAQDFVSSRHQRDEEPTFGKQTSHFNARRERNPRPNDQQGIDVEDMRELASHNDVQRVQRRNRKPLRKNEKGDFDSSTRGATYDYKSRPEGNRALRRALKFGHKIDSEVRGQSSSAIRRAAHRKAFHGDKNHTSDKDLFGRRTFKRTPRRAATLMHRDEQEQEQEHGLWMPEELQDDIDPSASHHRPHFSMGRQLGRTDHAPFVQRTMGKDYRGRNPEGFERDLSQKYEPQSSDRDTNVPLSIPYTTPASEFLYGTNVVLAALLSSRRKFYKLYIYAGGNREVHEQDRKIRELALELGVVVERVKEDQLRLMDKMSVGRPHNGYILESSPLPKLPVLGFRAVDERSGPFHVILEHQSREDEAINGTSTMIKYKVGFPRYPFVLLLDGILDPGNLGAIMRTAFFLGVDTVAISKRSAPVSPVAIKASSGACESLPIVSVSRPASFIDDCKGNGWKVYAAAAPTLGKRTRVGNFFYTSNLGSPVRDHPCLLILGGEGEGVQWNIQRKADIDVGIHGPRLGQGQVDSLNVSVAAGLLCEAFLRKPAGRRMIDQNAHSDAEIGAGTPNDSAEVHTEKRIF